MESPKSPDSGTESPLIIRFYDHDIQANDSRGRTLEQILAWGDEKLERSHNYIQMLFPLPEGSPYNWEAPVITREVMEAFRSRVELRDHLRKSFERMLDFYGFALSRNLKNSEEKKSGEVSDRAEQTATPAVDPDAAIAANADSSAVTTTGSTHASAKSTENSTGHSTTDAVVPTDYQIIRGLKWRTNSRNWCIRFDHNHLRITRILRCLRVLGLQTECDAFFKTLKDVVADPAIKISDRSLMYWHRAVARPLYVAPDDEECAWLKKWEREQKEQQ